VGTGRDAAVIEAQELAVLGDGSEVRLEGRAARTRAILVAGRPLREPVARYGPFVMNTREEIMQAFSDYQTGKF
jgi:redox-sensitive bicupin YhaK (pirin superfamily)